MTLSPGAATPIEEILRRAGCDPREIAARRTDLDAQRREAAELERDPYSNLHRLVESALHHDTERYFIVTDLDRDAPGLRRFLWRHFFWYRALRARLLRDRYVRAELRERATGWFGRITPLDVFRYIAEHARGAAAVSLGGKGAVLLLCGFQDREKARSALLGSARDHPVTAALADPLDAKHLSFVVRLQTRHEAAHSEDGMRHRSGLRNQYKAEPESDASMTLLAVRDAELLGGSVADVLESLASLRELTGERYFFCSHAIRRALEVPGSLLVRMEPDEISRLSDAIADVVVPDFETLQKVESALFEMWQLTRSRAVERDPAHPNHVRLREHLADERVAAWLGQTLTAFERFGLEPGAHDERVLDYARRCESGRGREER